MNNLHLKLLCRHGKRTDSPKGTGTPGVGPLGDVGRGRPAGGDRGADASFRREDSDGYSNVVVAASLNLIRSCEGN